MSIYDALPDINATRLTGPMNGTALSLTNF